MSKPLRKLASLFVLSAIVLGSSACVVRERRGEGEHHEHHEEVIVR